MPLTNHACDLAPNTKAGIGMTAPATPTDLDQVCIDLGNEGCPPIVLGSPCQSLLGHPHH